MSGEKKLLYLVLWTAGCVVTLITGPWNHWVNFFALMGLVVSFFIVLIVLYGIAVGVVTRNIKREWEK